MPLVIADRVRETTLTSGTDPIALAGPYSGFQAFSIIGNGNTTYYVIIDAQNGAWEVGVGTYASVGNTLARTTVLASSNAGSLVNFGAGTKDVILTQPAGRSVLVQQGGAGLLTGTAAFTANGIPYANSTSTLITGSALTFDGTNLGIGTISPTQRLDLGNGNLILGTAIFTGTGVSTEDVALELGVLRSASGNVYIDLHATAGTDFSARFVRFAGANGVLELSNVGTGDLRIRQGNLAPIVFDTGSTERMRIDASGNVGIGTSSPTAKLTVAGAGSVWTTVQNTASTADAFFQAQTTLGSGYFGISPTGQYMYTADSIPLLFSTAATERMRIDSAGNVGIGTSTPVAPLQVSNNLPVLVLDELDGTSTHRQTWMLRNGNEYQLQTRTSTGTFAGLDYVMPTGSSGATAHVWYTANTEKVRIDSAGNVGIGTSTPGDKLEIGGAGAGIILASPNGTRYRVTVSNLGVLTVAAV
jgi:hypothetical protein